MKKLNFILIIVLFVLFFIPTSKVLALQTYVKIKVNSISLANGSSFDLPTGTKVTVLDGASSLGVNTTLSDTAPGSYLWSSLVNLTSGHAYVIKIETPICSGKFDSTTGYCWYKGNIGESCTQVCARNSTTTLSTTCNEPDPGCSIMTSLGFNCPTCYSGSYAPYSYNYYGTPYCLQGDYSGQAYCDWSDSYYGSTRICTCNKPLGAFDFSFTPVF